MKQFDFGTGGANKDDEFYIIHFDSGTIINWYKHIGRTNTCNDEDFTLNDLREMLILLKEDLEWR